jgi:glycerol-3-phosphate dehydrogenase (NAD(P)+)
MDKQLEVGVYGSGAWGTTVAKLLVEKGCAVQLWCHEEEVARGKITGLISASRNGAAAIRFRELLAGERLLVFSSLDVRGVQISAAVKNVVAIAFGVLEALSEFSDQFGDNTESLLLAAGLNEIQRLGIAMGASHPETFTSIAGVGDLEVTCRSKFGRNRRFGREVVLDHLLERFSDIESVIGGMPGIGYFAEGVVTARHVETLARQHRLGLPICHGVYRILNREVEPTEAVESILREMP